MRVHPKGREHQHTALFRFHAVIEVVEERLAAFLDIGQGPENASRDQGNRYPHADGIDLRDPADTA